MKTVLRCAVIASAFMLTAGSAAWAQGYSSGSVNQGVYGNQGTYSQNDQGYYNQNQGTRGNLGPAYHRHSAVD